MFMQDGFSSSFLQVHAPESSSYIHQLLSRRHRWYVDYSRTQDPTLHGSSLVCSLVRFTEGTNLVALRSCRPILVDGKSTIFPLPTWLSPVTSCRQRFKLLRAVQIFNHQLLAHDDFAHTFRVAVDLATTNCRWDRLNGTVEG